MYGRQRHRDGGGPDDRSGGVDGNRRPRGSRGAEEHFTAAAELEERLGAPLFLARTRADWARALIGRGRPEDLQRAQHMLEQAEEAAGRLGADGITREVAECRTALATISG